VSSLPLVPAPGSKLLPEAALSTTVNAGSMTGAVCLRTDKFNGRVNSGSPSIGKA
jgi:hypothetical protein